MFDIIHFIIKDLHSSLTNETDMYFSKNAERRIQDAVTRIYNLNQELMDIEVRFFFNLSYDCKISKNLKPKQSFNVKIVCGNFCGSKSMFQTKKFCI